MGIRNLSKVLAEYEQPFSNFSLDGPKRLFIGFDVATQVVALWDKYFERSTSGYEKRLAGMLMRKTLETVGLICQKTRPKGVYVYVAMEARSGLSVRLKDDTRQKRALKERPNYGSLAKECISLLRDTKFVKTFCGESYLKKQYGLQCLLVEVDDDNEPSEGEHKIFVRAKELHANHPLVVSIDGDCIHIGILRWHAQDFREVTVLNMTRQTYVNVSSLPKAWCETLFALGNDFSIKLLSGTPEQLAQFQHASSLDDLIKECLGKKLLKFRKSHECVERFIDYLNTIVSYYQSGHCTEPYVQFDRGSVLTHWNDLDVRLIVNQPSSSSYVKPKYILEFVL